MADKIKSILRIVVIIIIISSCCVPLIKSLCSDSWGRNNRFLDAIEFVETERGDTPRSLGLYQITGIFVDDVNRILGYDKYKYIDRLDRQKSQAMILIFLEHYATPERLGRPATLEDKARMIKGGPNGYKDFSTCEYWKKVKEQWAKN